MHALVFPKAGLHIQSHADGFKITERAEEEGIRKNDKRWTSSHLVGSKLNQYY
jgi:hypothetical protein